MNERDMLVFQINLRGGLGVERGVGGGNWGRMNKDFAIKTFSSNFEQFEPFFPSFFLSCFNFQQLFVLCFFSRTKWSRIEFKLYKFKGFQINKSCR